MVSLVMIYLFQSIAFLTHCIAKQPTTYGRVYNIQDYINASGGDADLGFNRCLTDISEKAFYATEAVFTILIPRGVYTIDNKLHPINGILTFKRDISVLNTEVTLNIIGLDIDHAALQAEIGTNLTCPLGFVTHPLATTIQQNYLSSTYTSNGIFITSSNETYLNQHIARTQMVCNNNPKDANFITAPFLSGGTFTGPKIECVNSHHHCFFYLRNDADASGPANFIINMMGIYFKGIDQVGNSHIYNATSVQHNVAFESCIMVNMLRCKSVFFDNNILEDVYGSGLYVNNKEYLFENNDVVIDSNIVKDVWQLVYVSSTSGWDQTGDGINTAGIDGGISRCNYIVNNIAATKQSGRLALGTCCEGNKNTTATHNYVSGYDRGFHVENAWGGFLIETNRVVGSETGIVFDTYINLAQLAAYCPLNNPITIRGNYFSNEGIPSASVAPYLRKLYRPYLIAAQGAFGHTVYDNSVFEDNYFKLDKSQIRTYDLTNTYLGHGNPNTYERRHVVSGLRRQQFHCNIFETMNSQLDNYNSGLYLISNHANNDDPSNNSNICMVNPLVDLPYLGIGGGGIVTNTLPVIFQDNMVIDCNLMKLHQHHSSASTMLNNLFLNSPANTNVVFQPSGSVSSSALASFFGVENPPTVTSHCACDLYFANTNFCCNPNYFYANGNRMLLDGNPNYQVSILSTSNISNHTFFVHGNLEIDQSTTFTGCTFLFTPNAKITVAAGQTLTLNGCTLKAGCNAMWDGIYASDPSAEIVIENGSTLQDMEHGVVVSGQAKLTSTNSNFINSYNGIQLLNLPSTFNGIIQNCTFIKTGTLLPRNTSTPNPLITGIRIVDCEKVIVGDEANINLKNDFESLQTGIYIENNLTTSGLSDITTNYNTFTNIIGTMHIWDYPFITNNLPLGLNPAGCAIFGINNVNTHQVKLNHKGNNNPSNIDFETCYKAIVLNSIQAQILENYTHQTEAAFLVYSTGQIQAINDNYIDDTYIGINLSGSNWGGINRNEISNIKAYNFGVPVGFNYWGKGINWLQFSSSTSGGVNIANNTILSDMDDFVIGIDASNTHNGKVFENSITFSSLSTTPSMSIYQNLIGISLNRSSGLDIQANNIQGTNGLTQDQRRTCGINMLRSPNNYLHCNINDNLQRGITVIGNCIGNNMSSTQINGGVEQNRVTTTRFGWLFRHLTTNGTLGDIGEQGVYDANNKFYNLGSIDLKVHRVFPSGFICDPFASHPTIYTNPSNLEQIHSTTNLTSPTNPNDCSYEVNNLNPGDQYICNPTINIAPPNTGTEINIEQALEIANNDIEYTEFADMGENYDERALFAYLVKDSNARSQYPVLNQFYMANFGGNIDLLNQMDDFFTQLMTPIILENATFFNSILTEANMTNNSIVDTEMHVQKEKHVNALQLQVIDLGYASLQQSDWEWISDLANECPFVAGIGVYKARMLYSCINPLAYFDDLKICNSVGVAKNATGLFDDENAALDSMTSSSGAKLVHMVEGNKIKVYPNPSSDYVTISYHLNAYSFGLFQLLDMQGRVLKEVQLSPLANHVNFSVSELAKAIYTYRYVVNNTVLENGKFIKE